MADNARPPVAVRIVRPYETEEAFLESELETVGKTSVILIGAHSRPTGVILRFEVTLASGATVLRGEGRVLAHKENAFRGQPGLALRFTRLDPKSKALVDRAAAIREARLNDGAGRPASIPPPAPTPAPQTNPPARPSNPPPSMRPQSGSMRPQPGSMRPPSATSVRPTAPPQTTTSMPAPDPVLTQILTAPTPPPPQSAFPARRGGRTSQRPTSAPSQQQQEHVAREEERGDERPSTLVDDQEAEAALAANHAATVAVPSAPSDPPSPPTIPPAHPAPSHVAASTDGAARALAPPPNRDDLLSRLRQRSANMSEEQRASILNRR